MMKFPSLGTGLRMFEVDIRALGIFRIALGLIVLVDQSVKLMDWHAFLGPDGLAAREISLEIVGWQSWSIYWMTEHRGWPYVLEVARGVAGVLLVFGVRSRTMAGITFVLVISSINYNALYIYGGDRVLAVSLFFAMFLPIGGRYSLEALWHGQDTRRSFRSIGSAAYVTQVLLIFFMAGIMKTHPSWTSDYTAISMALHLEQFATESARLWRQYDTLTQILTFIVIWIEWVGPVVAILPGVWCRSIGVGALLILEIGIWFSLEVGLFPYISFISLIPLMPRTWWDLILERGKNKGGDWTLFYDQDCGFCVFACRLMKAVCGWDAARVRKAQEDAEAKRILDNNRSWSVTMAGTERYSSGWDAVRWMLEQSGRTGLLRWLPDGPRGREWYVWIGKRREKFSHAGRIVFGRRRWKTPGVTGEAVSTLAIGSVIAWNIASFPATREHVGDYQKYVNPWVATFNLRQYWTMFAPAPYLNDWWMVGIGLDREGQILQLFTGEELPDALKPPANGSRYYRIHRWRKLLNYAYRNGEMEHVLAYWCRTGRWQAMSVWMVWRRNLGTHETSRQPYQREKAWQWVCEEVNQEQLEKFEGEVSYRMDAGIQIEEPEYLQIDQVGAMGAPP